ncbi:MAG: MBG domain-containing protein [Spirochaetaceae bacterium]|nr:MBG domain-containing protein [Spirochaetaceae bacterium]
MSSAADPYHRWHRVGALIVALGVMTSSNLSLHAQDDRRERAIEDLAERLVAEILRTLPDDRKPEETSVALRPLSVDPTRLSSLPDRIRDDLSDWLSDWLGDEFAKARMTMRTRERLMDVYGTLEEYRSDANLSELLRKAGADVEIFCRTVLSGGDVYQIILRCSAELLQSAQKLGEERIAIPIELDDVFDVVMTDLASQIAEALPGAGEVVGIQLTEHGRPSYLSDFVGSHLSSVVAERIRQHEQWGKWEPIGVGEEPGGASAPEYILSGLLTCDADAGRIDLYLQVRVKKDGGTDAPLFSRRGYLPVSALPHGFTCTGAPTLTLVITVTNALRVYGGGDDLSFTVTGLTDGDTAAQVLTGGLGRASGSNVGTYAINFGTLAVTSAFTGKYVLPEVPTLGSYTITPRPITAIDGVTVVSDSADGATTASFDTEQATGTGVLASEVADFRAGGLLVREAPPSTEATTSSVTVTYTLANSGRFKAANYELRSGVETATLQPPPPAHPFTRQLEPPSQPHELLPPIATLPEPIPTPPERLAVHAARDDEAFARANSAGTAAAYEDYLSLGHIRVGEMPRRLEVCEPK